MFFFSEDGKDTAESGEKVKGEKSEESDEAKKIENGGDIGSLAAGTYIFYFYPIITYIQFLLFCYWFNVHTKYMIFLLGNEDKLWADVDRDIGEFLREVDPQGNEDSGDDEDQGR